MFAVGGRRYQLSAQVFIEQRLHGLRLINTGNGLTPVASSRIGRDAYETARTDGSWLQHHERINKRYILDNTKGYLNKGGEIV